MNEITKKYLTCTYHELMRFEFTAAVKTCPTCTYHELMQFQFYCCSKDMPLQQRWHFSCFWSREIYYMLPPHHTVKVWVPLFKFKAGKHLKRASRYTSV